MNKQSAERGPESRGCELSMPERNILRVYHEWITPGWIPLDRASVIQYYAPISHQTAGAFGLGKSPTPGPEECIEGRVDAILDQAGNIVTLVNDRFRFQTFSYTSKFGDQMVGIGYPDDFVQQYGLRVNEYVDVTFERIRRTKPAKSDTEIFPRVLRYGEVAIKPQAFGVIAPGQIPDRLIPSDFRDQFYADLVLELNYAYGYGLQRSSEILFRTLIENLLIDLLRDKYTVSKVTLFYDTRRQRFHDLSVLIASVRAGLPDFSPYSASVDKSFCDLLNGYREIGNAKAHKLEATAFSESSSAKRTEMANIVALLKSTIEKIRGRAL
jgi:hypothetical protein